MLIFLIGGELYEYFTRTPSKASFAGEGSSLPLLVGMQRNPAMKQKTVTIPERIVESKDTEPEAAKLWAVYRDLQKEPIKRDDLSILANSKLEKERVFASVFTVEKLTQEQAIRVGTFLGKDEVDEYARLRAREKAGLEANWDSFTKKSIAAGVVVALALLGGGAGCVLIILYLSARSKGSLQPIGHPALPMSQIESDVYATRVVMILILIMFGPFLISMATGRAPGTGLVAPFVVIVAVLALCRWRIGHVRVDRWSMKNSLPGFKAVGAGALIYLMGLPLIITATILGSQIFSFLPPPEHPATKMIPTATTYQLAIIFISAAIQAPIVEEIAFRGTLLPAMVRLLNRPVAAVILTNLIFAAIHPTGIPAWPALAMVGIVASFAVYQTGSILSAMTIHALHNGALLIFSLMITR